MSRILLVRHGQASWGSADYDVLSAVGGQQARLLGADLAGRGVRPDLVLHGAMTRQRETAGLVAEAAGWPCPVEQDDDWDEMDHHEVLSRQPVTFDGDRPSPEEFQVWFEAAVLRWTGGGADADYAESFPAFGQRVLGALRRLAGRLGQGSTAVVVTSGGPVARVATELLGGGVEQHRRLAPVVVNTSVSTVAVGGRGSTLVSFNDHSHLEPRGLVTYR